MGFMIRRPAAAIGLAAIVIAAIALAVATHALGFPR